MFHRPKKKEHGRCKKPLGGVRGYVLNLTLLETVPVWPPLDCCFIRISNKGVRDGGEGAGMGLFSST